MNPPDCKRQINRTEKSHLFPLLYNKGFGIGVDPNHLRAVCIKMMLPRIGAKYNNEIIEDTIVYMMSKDRSDHFAFYNSFQTNEPIRVLLCDGPKDYDLGFWYIHFLDITSDKDKHAILKQDQTTKLEPAVYSQAPEVVQTRSQLETQWARFFDASGLKYQFEPKTFTLLLGKTYTPDFYLPILNAYIEIKPMKPCVDTMYKCLVLSAQIPSERVIILYGFPMEPFVAINRFDEETNRYQDDTSKRYTGMVFQNGKLIQSNFVFMEIDGKIDLCEINEQNTIYNQYWISPNLTRAYETACRTV